MVLDWSIRTLTFVHQSGFGSEACLVWSFFFFFFSWRCLQTHSRPHALPWDTRLIKNGIIMERRPLEEEAQGEGGGRRGVL